MLAERGIRSERKGRRLLILGVSYILYPFELHHSQLAKLCHVPCFSHLKAVNRMRDDLRGKGLSAPEAYLKGCWTGSLAQSFGRSGQK